MVSWEDVCKSPTSAEGCICIHICMAVLGPYTDHATCILVTVTHGHHHACLGALNTSLCTVYGIDGQRQALLVFKDHGLMYHSTLGVRVIQKKKTMPCILASARTLTSSVSCT